jgi:hypothetical protein
VLGGLSALILILNEMLILLSIGCATFYIMGAIFSIAVTGWNITKTNELIKILTWPISIFFEKN